MCRLVGASQIMQTPISPESSACLYEQLRRYNISQCTQQRAWKSEGDVLSHAHSHTHTPLLRVTLHGPPPSGQTLPRAWPVGHRVKQLLRLQTAEQSNTREGQPDASRQFQGRPRVRVSSQLNYRAARRGQAFQQRRSRPRVRGNVTYHVTLHWSRPSSEKIQALAAAHSPSPASRQLPLMRIKQKKEEIVYAVS